ncbi:MAG: fibronectin type III domain-containing protein [Gammaproteobacteria bacterium]|nr:fibronectin type III domain-containing protein [Gammaproteobacteria bacterium]
MKHIYYGTAFAFMITVITSSVICFQLIQAKGEDIKSSEKNDSTTIQTVQIELKKPITLDALFPVGTNFSSDEIILESEFTFDGEDIYDFYVVSSKGKKKNIKEDYIKNRKAFLVDTKDVAKMSSANSKNVENILVTKITVTDKKGNIDEMKKGLEINKINVKPVQSIIAPQIFEKSVPKEARLLDDKNAIGKKIDNKTFAVAAESASLDSLVPNSGTSYFYPSSHGGRYVYQFMKWDSVNFSEEQTYEHDVFLYNYDRKTYLDGGTTSYPGCWPELTYAATSWPVASRPYIDTRFGYNEYNIPICEIDELIYTIGAAQASALQANIRYYTYIRTENGNDSSDKFKLQAQIGHRVPNSCYSTWCSFGDGHYDLIPSWSTTVPGTQNWTYVSAPAAPSNVLISSPTSTSLRVNFTDNATNETSIAVERRKLGWSWNLLGYFGSLPETSNWYWINTGLNSGTTYCYRLKAFNATGSSAYSNEACGTTL